MKNDYFFTTNERMLLARHYKDIKENCYEALRRLNKCDKDSIYNYSIQFNNPEKYATKFKKLFLPENELVKFCDIKKIQHFFIGDYIEYNKRRCYTSTIKLSYDSLRKIIAIIHSIPELDIKTADWIELASLVHDRFAFCFDNMQIIFEAENDTTI